MLGMRRAGSGRAADAGGRRLQAVVRPGSTPAVAPLPTLRRPVVAHPRSLCNRRKRDSTPPPISTPRDFCRLPNLLGGTRGVETVAVPQRLI